MIADFDYVVFETGLAAEYAKRFSIRRRKASNDKGPPFPDGCA